MNLSDFYDVGDEREIFRTPFNIKDRTIATNGHVLISTPRIEKYKDTESSAMIKRIPELLEGFPDLTFIDLPQIELPAHHACEYCKGKGKAEKTDCRECHGHGDLDVQSEYNSYEVECKTCCGAGIEVKIDGDAGCFGCSGHGKRFGKNASVEICEVKINPIFFLLINSMPDIKVAEKIEAKSLAFKSGDYEGIIMGLES